MIRSDPEHSLANMHKSLNRALLSRCAWVLLCMLQAKAEIYALVQGVGHLWGPGGRSSGSTMLVLVIE